MLRVVVMKVLIRAQADRVSSSGRRSRSRFRD
jgi:hypothetical protein